MEWQVVAVCHANLNRKWVVRRFLLFRAFLYTSQRKRSHALRPPYINEGEKMSTTEPAQIAAGERGTDQTFQRTSIVLDLLAKEPENGLRFTDLKELAGFSKATLHSLLAGLVSHGFVDNEGPRYYPGFRLGLWAAAARNRHGFAQRVGPIIRTLSEEVEDTAYLSIRVKEMAVCVVLHEGTGAVRALPLSPGDHSGLGVGSAAAAILATIQDEQEIEAILRSPDRWLSIVDQAARGFSQAGPATRQQFEQSMQQADAAVIAAVLPQVVDEAVNNAKGLNGLRALQALSHQPFGPAPGSPMSVLSDEGLKARQDSRRRLQERAEQIAAQVAAEEGARIDALAKGLAGLEQGRLWHAEYQTHIAPYAGHASELGQLQPRFMTLREAALLQSQAELLDLIRMAPDHETLTALQARYLLKEDLTTAPGNAVASAVAQRAHEIDRAVALGATLAKVWRRTKRRGHVRPHPIRARRRHPKAKRDDRAMHERRAPGRPAHEPSLRGYAVIQGGDDWHHNQRACTENS